MAYIETNTKNACNMLLNMGTDAQGNTTTKSVSLGTLSDNWDVSKAAACADAIENCLAHTMSSLVHVATNTITEAD